MKKQIKDSKPVSKKAIPKSFDLNTLYPFPRLQCFAFIALLTTVLYINSLWNDYTLDDSIVIKENIFTQQGYAGIKQIMSSDVFLGFFKSEKNLVAGGRYRPLSLVTFAIEKEWWGFNPGMSHLVNLLLYSCTGIMILVFLTRLFSFTELKKYKWLPLLSAALYIAHPLHTEAVTNIKGRDEIMALLFVIMSANYFLKYYDSSKLSSLVAGSFAFFLALLSKENAITWLAIIPLLFYFFRNFDLKKSSTPIVASIIVSGIYLAMRQSFTNTSLDKEVTEILNNPFAGASMAQKYATIIYTFGKYLLLLIFPHPLTHDYYFNQIPLKEFSNIGVILSILIYSIAGVVAVIQFRKKTLLSFCILYFAITFSVVSNLFFPVGTTMSERFMYMSSLSFSIYLAYLILLITEKYFNKSNTDSSFNLLKNIPAMAIIGILLLGYSVKTIARNPAWKDNYTLFSTDVKTSTESAKLNNAVGGTSLEFLDKQDVSAQDKKKYTQQAKIALENAISIYPQYTNAWLLLGNAYLKGDSNYTKAAQCYMDCLHINPLYEDANSNLNVAFNLLKTKEKRILAAKSIFDSNPSNYTYKYYYARQLQYAGYIDSALNMMKEVIKTDSRNTKSYNDIGLMYGQDKGIIDSSIYYLEKAVAANPKFEDANDNLAIAYGIKREYQKAIDVLNKAISINPDHAKYYRTMGTTYQAMGDMNNATYYYAKAKELDPEIMK